MKRIIKIFKKFKKKFQIIFKKLKNDLKLFIQVYFYENWNRQVYIGAISDNPDEFFKLMTKWKTNLKYNYNYYIKWASTKGYTTIVKYLLKSNEVDPSVSNDFSLNIAAKEGHLDIVKLLLNDKRVNIDTSRQPIITSMDNHKYDITKYLLNKIYHRKKNINNTQYRRRGNFYTDHFYPINFKYFQYACNNGHIEIVEYLLTKSYLTLSFSFLVDVYNHEVFRVLLKDKRFNPDYDNNYILKTAVSRNQTEIVKVLLEDPRVDPTVDRYIILKRIIANKNIELLKILLNDKRIDPSVFNNTLLKSIDNRLASSENKTIINLLLKDDRVLSKISDKKNIKELTIRNILPNYNSKKKIINKKYR